MRRPSALVPHLAVCVCDERGVDLRDTGLCLIAWGRGMDERERVGGGVFGGRQRLQAAAAMTSAQQDVRYEQQVRAKVLREVDAAAHVQVSPE